METFQVLEVTENENLKFNSKYLKKILCDPKIKDKKVAVISVAGEYRTGKSFLLNFILQKLLNFDDEHWMNRNKKVLNKFKWESGNDASTKGIWMYPEPVIVKQRNGEEIVVILLDTQGTRDETSINTTARIFAHSTLLSSVQIFNLKQRIQGNDWDEFKLFADYGKVCSSNSDNTSVFQSLWFLIRDYNREGEKESNRFDYGKDGGKKYLNQCLNNGQHPERKNKVMKLFQEPNCFLIPHPGKEVTFSSFDGSVDKIEKDFLKQIELFVEEVTDSLVPKSNINCCDSLTCGLLYEYAKEICQRELSVNGEIHLGSLDEVNEKLSVMQAKSKTLCNFNKSLYDIENTCSVEIQKLDPKYYSDEPSKNFTKQIDDCCMLEAIKSFDSEIKFGDVALQNEIRNELQNEIKESKKRVVDSLKKLLHFFEEQSHKEAAQKALSSFRVRTQEIETEIRTEIRQFDSKYLYDHTPDSECQGKFPTIKSKCIEEYRTAPKIGKKVTTVEYEQSLCNDIDEEIKRARQNILEEFKVIVKNNHDDAVATATRSFENDLDESVAMYKEQLLLNDKDVDFNKCREQFSKLIFNQLRDKASDETLQNAVKICRTKSNLESLRQRLHEKIDVYQKQYDGLPLSVYWIVCCNRTERSVESGEVKIDNDIQSLLKVKSLPKVTEVIKLLNEKENEVFKKFKELNEEKEDLSIYLNDSQISDSKETSAAAKMENICEKIEFVTKEFVRIKKSREECCNIITENIKTDEAIVENLEKLPFKTKVMYTVLLPVGITQIVRYYYNKRQAGFWRVQDKEIKDEKKYVAGVNAQSDTITLTTMSQRATNLLGKIKNQTTDYFYYKFRKKKQKEDS